MIPFRVLCELPRCLCGGIIGPLDSYWRSPLLQIGTLVVVFAVPGGSASAQETPARKTMTALRMADECGLDLDSVEGTGAEGRITVKDVREAVEA